MIDFQPTAECPYCGKQLPEIVLTVSGHTFRKPMACDCQESILAELNESMVLLPDEAASMAGVPAMFRDSSCDVDGYLDMIESGKGLYLFGNVGVGKTYTACSIAVRYNELHAVPFCSSSPAVFISSMALLMGLQATYSTNVTEEQAFSVYATCKLLVIDDIGKEPPTEWAISRLYRLVDQRYENELVTVYTSQYPRDLLASKMSIHGEEIAAAIVSRICETCEAVELKGRDRRLR